MSVVKIAVGSNIYEMYYESDEEKEYLVSLGAKINQKVNETIRTHNLKNQEYALLLTCLTLATEQQKQDENLEQKFSTQEVIKIISFLKENLSYTI